jgi:hypothetical protein
MRKHFRLTTIFVLIFISYTAIADKVNVATAHKIAANFYYETSLNAGINIKAPENLTLSYTKYLGSEEMYYVFSSTNGFVIIAADDNCFPILGYSFEGKYLTGNVSPEFSEWMNDEVTQIKYIRDHSLLADNKISTTWQKYLSNNFVPQSRISGSTSVEPLLLSTWDQGTYYNYLCPADIAGQDGHVWTGCVATAMSQIMYYYRYPQHGTGSHGYTSNYGYLSADFGSTTYNWYAMQNSINGKYNLDMAQLQSQVGISIDMNYDPSGSGAYMWDDVNSMKNYFGYSSSTQLYYHNDYNDNDWANLIIANLDNKMPVQYAGFGSEGGHAFVCDGYQGTNYFHFNWGWSGSFNGYYYLNNLNPGYTFNDGHQVILNSYPAANYPQNCTGLTTLTNTFGTIEDGSGPRGNYQDNKDCMWLIAPSDVIDNIRITFDRLNTESDNDVVTIYDGESTSDPVLGIFSGNTIPQPVVSSGKKVLVRFTSDGTLNADGWLLTFNGKLTTFCNNLTELYSPAGTISDGSDINTYNNNTNCRWRIILPAVSNVTINFNSFNLASDVDFVRVYDETTSTLIGSFTNANPPQSVSLTTDRVLIFFKTNGLTTAQGWDLNYSAIPLAVQENTGSYLLIAPNPATDYLNVESTIPDINQLDMEIVNSIGKVVLTKKVNCTDNKLSERIDISSFASGIYFLKLTSANYSKTQLFTKQ